MTRAQAHFTAFDRTAPTAYARTEPDVLADAGSPVRTGLEAAAVDVHLGAGRGRRLAGVVERRDRVAVRRRRLERQRRRATGVGERGVVPEHLVAVLQRHLVGADRR